MVQRTKQTAKPPRVCFDCFWRREYAGLERLFLELRKENMKMHHAIKSQESQPIASVKGSGLFTMPSTRSFAEIDDRDDLPFLDGLTRRHGDD